MHGAKPIIIKPVMYSGLSLRKVIAKRNMIKGPTIHVIKKERRSNLGFAITFGIVENFTFVKGGYIIKIKPIASGIFVVPVEN
jgi:hypothetical protein